MKDKSIFFRCQQAKQISPEKPVELFILADQRSDVALKKFVGEFIRRNQEEVAKSEKWPELKEKNPHLMIELLTN